MQQLIHISEMGRPMQERMKELERDICLICTQTSAISENANMTGLHLLWNKVKFIDWDSITMVHQKSQGSYPQKTSPW